MEHKVPWKDSFSSLYKWMWFSNVTLQKIHRMGSGRDSWIGSFLDRKQANLSRSMAKGSSRQWLGSKAIVLQVHALESNCEV